MDKPHTLRPRVVVGRAAARRRVRQRGKPGLARPPRNRPAAAVARLMEALKEGGREDGREGCDELSVVTT